MPVAFCIIDFSGGFVNNKTVKIPRFRGILISAVQKDGPPKPPKLRSE